VRSALQSQVFHLYHSYIYIYIYIRICLSIFSFPQIVAYLHREHALMEYRLRKRCRQHRHSLMALLWGTLVQTSQQGSSLTTLKEVV
jgi:hypothetical protein